MKYTMCIVYNSGYMLTNCEKTFKRFMKALSKEQRKTVSTYIGDPKIASEIIAELAA